MKLNLPTKLTVLRLILIPFCMVAIIYPIFSGDIIWRVVAAGIFIAASLTDMLDGKIARKYNMVTDIGKFLDPIADKMLVFGVMISLILRYYNDNYMFTMVLGWALFITILRDMAISSLRMIAAGKDGTVIAAAWLGKVKTTVQMVGLVVIMLEPIIFGNCFYISYVFVAAMIVLTLWSAIDYFLPFLKKR